MGIGTVDATSGNLRGPGSWAMLGTLVYMAPEQLLGERVDARVDVFAFCVALFEEAKPAIAEIESWLAARATKRGR